MNKLKLNMPLTTLFSQLGTKLLILFDRFPRHTHKIETATFFTATTMISKESSPEIFDELSIFLGAQGGFLTLNRITQMTLT